VSAGVSQLDLDPLNDLKRSEEVFARDLNGATLKVCARNFEKL